VDFCEVGGMDATLLKTLQSVRSQLILQMHVPTHPSVKNLACVSDNLQKRHQVGFFQRRWLLVELVKEIACT
jgi:hypothetical protein